MKTSFWACVTLTVVALLSTCFAGTAYVVTDNDNSSGNSATIYSLNTSTGVLTHVMDLPTGGLGSSGGYFATTGTGAVVTGITGCLLVYDGGSSDIASFNVNLRTFNITKVGNFSNGALTSSGGSLAVSPNGKFLYATYPGTENLGAWTVNADCSLTFIAAYEASVGPDLYDGIKVTPNGHDLIVAAPDYSAVEEFAINQTTGALNDLGFANFGGLSECITNGCYPGGIDITADSKGAIIGNYSLNAPSALGAEITSTGLTHATYLPIANTGSLTYNDNVPFLSAAAYHGSGPLYLGFSGTGSGSQPGVATATFSEAHASITGKASTPISSPVDYQGLIASTGNLMVVSEWFNTLQVFTINANGTLTATSQGPVVNNDANGAYSFFIYPNTR
ncbi:MAG: beta-propeller fold lactonase family protein [Terriglobales bacterium]